MLETDPRTKIEGLVEKAREAMAQFADATQCIDGKKLAAVTTKRDLEQTMQGDKDRDTTERTAEILRLVAEGVEAPSGSRRPLSAAPPLDPSPRAV